MKLNIADTNTFLNEFLSPLSRISEGGVLTFQDNKITSLAATCDNTIIIYSEYLTPTPDTKISLNIPDLKKFHKLLTLVDGPLELEIANNSIAYHSDSFRFKMHTFEEGILSIPPLTMSKLSKIYINFDSAFTITNTMLTNLIKGSTLTMDVKKVYISSSGNKVHAELTDKNQDLTDVFASLLSEDYQGPVLNSIPINFEIMRILNTTKISQFVAKYASSIKVFNFEVKTNNVNINYIISALKD